MTKNRNLDREGLEVYLLHFLLASRQYFLLFGLMMMFVAYSFRFSTLVGSLGFLFAVLILLLTVSFPFVSLIAKIGVWVGTIGKLDQV